MFKARRERLPGLFIPRPDAPRQALLLDAGKISAGFPSPAADYEDKRRQRSEDAHGYATTIEVRPRAATLSDLVPFRKWKGSHPGRNVTSPAPAGCLCRAAPSA